MTQEVHILVMVWKKKSCLYMSEDTVKYNEATRSGKITLFYKYINFLFEWIRGICEDNNHDIFLQT